MGIHTKGFFDSSPSSIAVTAEGLVTGLVADYRNGVDERAVVEQAVRTNHHETSEMLSTSIQAALDRYPDFAYHNRAHGCDVIRSTMKLVDSVGVFTPHARNLLVIAAAWHDAGYGDPADQWQPYGSKEAYAAALCEQASGDSLSKENSAYVKQAIMGTKIDAPRQDAAGRLLHLADLDYMSGSWETFLEGALRYKREEQPAMPWLDFLELQRRFLSMHQKKECQYLTDMGAPEYMIKKRTLAIQRNLDRILRHDTEPAMPSRRLARAALTSLAT